MMRHAAGVCALFGGLLMAPHVAFGQAQAQDATSLAKATQNPVADLTSLPFQFNFNTGGDLVDRTFLNLNIQPVIPFKLTSGLNAISRTIVPIDSVPTVPGESVSGFGDIQEQLFLTSSHPGKLIWGVGPVFSFPTATASAVATGTWGGGISAVVLAMPGPFVIGGLLSQIWPMSDTGGAPETNLFTLQPFVNYNFGEGWALSYSPIISANWDAPTGNQWTFPVGMGITRTTILDGRPMNLSVQYYYNAVRPDGSAGQTLRLVIALLYPRR